MRLSWPRPAGIRNGGLLLTLTLLAAMVALVEEPDDRVGGWRLPNPFRYLVPPAGISQQPPAGPQPTAAADPSPGREGDPVALAAVAGGAPDAGRASRGREAGAARPASPGRRLAPSPSPPPAGNRGARPAPPPSPPAPARRAAPAAAVSVRVEAPAVAVPPPGVVDLPVRPVETPAVRVEVPVALP
jgi:hypothetical protein